MVATQHDALGQGLLHGHARAAAQLGQAGHPQAQPGLGVHGLAGQPPRVLEQVVAQVPGLVEDEPLCADIDGFSVHAAVRVEAHDRKRLEQ